MTGFATYPSLRDRVAFVSGGASGLGAELVAQLAAQGARVAFVDVQDGTGLASSVAADGHLEPLFQHCDVRDVEALRVAIAVAADRLGPVTVLVNNAANDVRIPVDDITVEKWDELSEVNVRHHFFATQAVRPMMREAGGGSVINLGSGSARRRRPGRAWNGSSPSPTSSSSTTSVWASMITTPSLTALMRGATPRFRSPATGDTTQLTDTLAALLPLLGLDLLRCGGDVARRAMQAAHGLRSASHTVVDALTRALGPGSPKLVGPVRADSDKCLTGRSPGRCRRRSDNRDPVSAPRRTDASALRVHVASLPASAVRVGSYRRDSAVQGCVATTGRFQVA